MPNQSATQSTTLPVSHQTLNRIAAANNVQIPAGQDQDDYLFLLQCAEACIQTLENSPDYIHPALRPLPGSGDRRYWKPASDDNPLNAWSHRCEISIAGNATSTSLLRGRTVCVKDNISVAGLPTTIGTFPQLVSQSAEFPISPIDATVVSRVLDAGGIILGTATCENYSASPESGSSPHGPVHNPWLRGFTAGGSSSGCGALVGAVSVRKALGKTTTTTTTTTALGLTADLAIGGDQGGSIRIPASYNGIYGMKATHGLIPYTGVAALAPMVDHVGPMASTLEDIALLLKVLAGYDGLDPRMTPESPLRGGVADYPSILSSFKTRVLAPGDKIGSGMRIGLLREAFEDSSVSPPVRDCVSDNARKYFTLAGAQVVDISVPLHTQGPAIWTIATRASMLDWGVKSQNSGILSHGLPHLQPRWPMDQEMYDLQTAASPEFIDLVLAGTLFKDQGPALEAKAHRKIFELRAAYDAALAQVDVLVTPCMPTVAMPHHHEKPNSHDGGRTGSSTIREKMASSAGCANNTCPFNVTGHPAMNVPCGFGDAVGAVEGKLPIGMQIVSRRWREDVILNAAAVFEEGERLSRL